MRNREKRASRYTRVRKYNGRCERCGKPTPETEIRSRVDESNAAITYHAPYLCPACYSKTEAQA